MLDISFQPTVIVSTTNLVLTLAFQYVPGLRLWWAKKSSEVKRSVFLIGGVVLTLGWFVITLPALGLCTPEIGFTCTPTMASSLISALLALLIGVGGMDGFFNVLPEAGDVTAAKSSRAE